MNSAFLRLIPSEWRTPFETLRGWEVFTPERAWPVAALSVASVFFEAMGVAMIYPILTYVEAGRDVAALAEKSTLWTVLVSVSQTLMIPINLATLSLVVLAMVILRQVTNYVLAITIDEQKWRSGADVGWRCFNALLNSKAQHLQTIDTGRFVNLIDFQAQTAVTVWRSFATMIRLVLSFLIYGLVMITTAPVLSLMAMVLVGLLIASMNGYVRLARDLTRDVLTKRRQLTQFVSERWQAWKVLRLSDRLGDEVDMFRHKAGVFADASVNLTRVMQRLQVVMAPVMTGLALLMIYISLEFLAIPLSVITLFVVIFLRLMPLAQSFAGQRQAIANFSVSVETVANELRAARNQKEPDPGTKSFRQIDNSLSFKNVEFRYEHGEGAALTDLDLDIPARKITALTGPSGAGKTTLTDLIPRLIEPQGGQILVDNTPIKEFSISSLRRAISYAPQHAFIFNDTVHQNVRYARPDASDAEVETACRRAHAHAFIAELPEGYETILGEGGNRLSGGQRQRLALARVFLAKPLILILDEPTSALDHASEQKVHEALQSMAQDDGVTVIVVAHHLTTVLSADKLVVLEGGRVTACGLPQTLIQQHGWLKGMLQSGAHDGEAEFSGAVSTA